jgi:hypothetical protein
MRVAHNEAIDIERYSVSSVPECFAQAELERPLIKYTSKSMTVICQYRKLLWVQLKVSGIAENRASI